VRTRYPFACHGSINDSVHLFTVSLGHFFFLLLFHFISFLLACLPVCSLTSPLSRRSTLDPPVTYCGSPYTEPLSRFISDSSISYSSIHALEHQSPSIPFVFQLSNAIIPLCTPDRYSLPRSVLLAVVCSNCLILNHPRMKTIRIWLCPRLAPSCLRHFA
jgi:hypothetical protein